MKTDLYKRLGESGAMRYTFWSSALSGQAIQWNCTKFGHMLAESIWKAHANFHFFTTIHFYVKFRKPKQDFWGKLKNCGATWYTIWGNMLHFFFRSFFIIITVIARPIGTDRKPP